MSQRESSSSPAPDSPARRSTRRQSRTASALAALAVALPVVLAAGAPVAQAAAVDVRYDRLSGATRYETAAEIAEEYVDTQSRRRAPVDTVILTSGHDRHFGYALATPGLSRRYVAPLLLTEPQRLSSAVSSFLLSEGISKVFIVGGTDVVSARVESQVDSLRGVGVERIAGSDAYTTAVAVAKRVGLRPGVPGRYRSAGPTALIATGEVFADALAAGPLAYRGEHPVLLTPADELHPDVADFLRSSDTAHAVLFGGTAALSSEVESAVRRLGISVDRFYGTDRFGTAVRVAEELLGDRSPLSCFDGGDLGLANGWRSPDALASGALLGELCAPLLLTDGSELSSATGSFLESDSVIGDSNGDLQITVLGGPEAISSAVVTRADNAATLDPITARISAVQGRCHFTVSFDEPIKTADIAAIGNFTLENSSFDGTVDAGRGTTTTQATVLLSGAGIHSIGAVPVGCASPLTAGERIQLIDRVIGTAADRRTVRRTVVNVAHDRSRPRLTIAALEGAPIVVITSNEALEPGDRPVLGQEVTFVRGSQEETAPLNVGRGLLRHEVHVPLADGLRAGDRVLIADNSVADVAGNMNRQVSVTARRDTVAPWVSAVTVSEPVGRSVSSVSVDGRTTGSRIHDALTVRTKTTGEAYGAIGNQWALDVTLERDWTSARRSVVEVLQTARRIDVRVSDEKSLSTLAAELNADPSFRALFAADVTAAARGSATTLASAVRSARLAGGLSSVDLTVSWSELVRHCDSGAGEVDPGRIELDVDADGDYDYYLDGYFARRLAVEFTDAPDGNPSIRPGGAACDTAAGVPAGTLVARLESSRIDSLPTLRSRLFVRAGAATDLPGNQAVNRRVAGFVRP